MRLTASRHPVGAPYLRLTGRALCRSRNNCPKHNSFSYCRHRSTRFEPACWDEGKTAARSLNNALACPSAKSPSTPAFDYLVVNDSFDLALSQLDDIISGRGAPFGGTCKRWRKANYSQNCSPRRGDPSEQISCSVCTLWLHFAPFCEGFGALGCH